MKKAFAYARFSTDMQREESIDAQFRAIKEYCSRNKIFLVNTFSDEGISGTTDNRPEFQKMIKQAEEVDFIIVHKLDRFSRNKYDSAIYKRELNQKNVRVISVLENLDDSPESVILESVLEGMSEYFSKNLSREVKKGLYENAYKGKFNGGVPLFGYSIDQDKNYVINEYQAIAVRLIFDRFAKGSSYTEIINELDSLGYKTVKGNSFKSTTLYEMLSNERYIGTYIFSKEDYNLRNKKRNSHRYKNREDMIIIENGNPAIIDKKTWNLVKERQKLNSKTSNKSKWNYVLSPFLYCDECGERLNGTTRKNNQGRYYHYYRCVNKNCSQQSIRTDFLEEEFYVAFNEAVFSEENKKTLAKRMKAFLDNKKINIDKEKIENEIKEVEKQINNCVDFILTGSNSISVKNKIEELELKKFNLQNELLKSKVSENKIDINSIIEFINKYDKLEKFSIHEQQIILKFFIEKLKYKKGKLTIRLKLTEQCTTSGRGLVNGTEFPAPLLLWVVVKKVEFLGSTFFVVKQQGSRVPSRCEASWKGGVLIFKFKKEVIMKKVVNIEKTDSNFKDYILFDIETTGLNRTKDFMYMFGICEKKGKNLIYSQYYIEDESEEKELILKVNELLNTKKVISYNGDRFDFPFIRKKMEKYNISKVDFENIDIYRQLQKLNFFLDEPSLKAINLGKRLGFDVHDHVNQQEMPKIFKMYQELKDKEMLSKLIYHNYIDLQVLSYIYEYKESILNKILTINNKKFTGILKTIYIQKNYLITRLSNLKNIDINFHQSNYSITSNKDEIKISLELENGLIENNIKAKVFKSKYENKIFRESQNLTENFILITKNNKIIKENLLLLLNLI